MGRRKVNQTLHGLLVINKPYGMISKDVSRWIEDRVGREKIGHMGTLDPCASGVLPLLFGKATRLQEYLLEMDKAYEFEITFGQATDTMDAAGEFCDEGPWEHITEEQIQDICQGIEGEFLQTPPIYSALKYRGKPLYEYARESRQDEVPLDAFKKIVMIKSLNLLNKKENKARFSIVCSKGTYVRVIADVIARQAQSCGYVTELIRTQAAGFHIKDALSLESIEDHQGAFSDLIIPLRSIDLPFPKWMAPDFETTRKLKLGQKLMVDMRSFEESLSYDGFKRLSLRAIDSILLLDNNNESFGIGSAAILNMGRMAIQMRRGLS